MLYQISKASKYYGADTVFEDINFEMKRLHLLEETVVEKQHF